jgi:hypothetical protein
MPPTEERQHVGADVVVGANVGQPGARQGDLEHDIAARWNVEVDAS